MSGHSKWATIKRKKAGIDAALGQAFTRLIKEITIAARNGGGDPNGNPRLRTAILAAKGANMPADNIDRAVKKGTGELESVVYEEVTYEGYGPNGVAVMLDTVTDNKNRTASELRHLFSKNGGNMGSQGCVSWMFETKGLISVDSSVTDEDTLMSVALDAGADDVRPEEGSFDVLTTPAAFEAVKNALDNKKIPVLATEISKIPQNTVRLDFSQATTMLKLMDALEEFDDTQKVYSNFDIPAEVMAKLDK
ncbi:YebC/PmpR family DNA-binding transcriptional regulator [candidate division TA06 bacterium]|uniref:Probable transcriptional regulatory protein HY768_10630 n=1 Tax=candidate division TA06 bacterium TaxID=2250710 RepID=A0A933MIZ7_UNCT6|nr:YebC/PmpR family DNA-binding transcriptional regulator [candidate division TA06 bacterium]